MRTLRTTLLGPLVALAGLGMLVALVPAPAGASSATISGHIAVNSVSLNQAAIVTGTVTPATATTKVVVQRGIHGVWTDRQAGTVAANGTFSIGIRPSGSGIYALRVRSNGGSVDSPTFYLRVNPPPCTLPSVASILSDPSTDYTGITCLGAWGLVSRTDVESGDDFAPAVVHWLGSKWVVVDCDANLVPPTIYRACAVS